MGTSRSILGNGSRGNFNLSERNHRSEEIYRRTGQRINGSDRSYYEVDEH
jgi:hypothetical protein